MREQSREIAAKLRKRINEEKERQKDHVEKVKIDELRKWKETRAVEVQGNYDRILGSSIDANEEARREIEAQSRYAQRKQELDLIATQRGRTALRKEMMANQQRPHKATSNKPRCRSTEVQTDRIELRCAIEDLQSKEYQAMNRVEDLPPESLICDDHPISARSVDILEKSKRFVEDASRRLDEISEKVSRYQEAGQPDNERDIMPTSQKRDVLPRPVKSTNASRLRVDSRRKPAPPPRVPTNRPKKVIPSAKEPVSYSSAPSKPGSVVCYDHPNRFTKTYDIPKNIVVKNALDTNETEDDAVANALNETLTNIDMDNQKLARTQELKYGISLAHLIMICLTLYIFYISGEKRRCENWKPLKSHKCEGITKCWLKH